MSHDMVKVRLLFVDEGSYREEEIEIPSASAGGYERIIDCLREDPEVLKVHYVDLSRLCSASLVEANGDSA